MSALFSGDLEYILQIKLERLYVRNTKNEIFLGRPDHLVTWAMFPIKF